MPPSGVDASDDRPLVSVIIIFLDAERFLGEAIDSVFAQTYANWELLLVDDGSTDRSGDIARRRAAADSRLRCLGHEHRANRGQSASRNLGVAHASGDLLAFLDADDVWMPQKLERQVSLFAEFPRATMVCGRSEYWNGAPGKSPDPSSLAPRVGDPDALMEPPELLRRWVAGARTIPSSSGFVLRRDVMTRVGGFVEPFPRLYEDLAFMIKVFLHEPVFTAEECWDRIRRHPDSCVARATAAEWNDAWLFFLSWFEGYLRESGLQTSEYWAAVQKELWPFRHPVLFRLSRFAGRLAARAARGVRSREHERRT